MSRSVQQVIAELNAFIPSEEESETVGRLYELFEGFRAAQDPQKAIPAMFDLLERHPGAEFGNPGPLVHELEHLKVYEPFLRESLLRQPVGLTVWMVNRILSVETAPVGQEQWLESLRLVIRHPKASPSTRSRAEGFLKYQAENKSR